MASVVEGRFSTGVPYLRVGSGPPLLAASGLTSAHANPQGSMRRMSLAWTRPFAHHFTVYLANRRPGLAAGTTVADLAADYAGAIEQDLDEPAFVHGTSTGGSLALQLAVDRPDLVRRLVVSAAACRLSPEARRIMADVARLTESGDHRRATALMFGTGTSSRARYVAAGLGWVMGGGVADDPSDMLTTITAEDQFDAEPRLAEVSAPALVLGGTDDRFYTSDLFRRTAVGMPRGRLVLFPGRSHVHVAGGKVPAGVALGFLLG